MDLCQEADLPFWFPSDAAALGEAYTLCKRVADAVALLTQALKRAMAIGRGDLQTLCRLRLGEAQLAAGRLETAWELAEGALALAHGYQERGNEAYALRLLGDIAAHRHPSEVEQAEDFYRQSFAVAEGLSMRPLQTHCHLGLGTLYREIGRRDQARVELAGAIDLYGAMDMTFWLPQAEAALVHIGG